MADHNSAQQNNPVRHIYIIGAKSIGQYGGFESFILNLLKHHEGDLRIHYHVACKANGSGYMDPDVLPGAVRISDDSFSYCGAECKLIHIPESLGAAQAIYYDLRALKWVCSDIESNHISSPIVYILASRIGPFERRYVKRIHSAGGLVYQNPDGHEDRRGKWNPIIRRYWKLSEKYAVRNADLVICDSLNIEKYIREEYAFLHPETVFIAYGTDVRGRQENDQKITARYNDWLKDHGLTDGQFYLSVGRFVPENNYETMIREFMASSTRRKYAVITTEDDAYAGKLQSILNYRSDSRIVFTGTVYDRELLSCIRARAYAYIHGHEVGGTNPSLLESMGTTDLNLLYDVGFNREVAEDTAMYWSKDEGNLAELIDRVDCMDDMAQATLGESARLRMKEHYDWDLICAKYAEVFLR